MSKNYTFEDISQHFDLNIKNAAIKLGISTTTLKTMCRNLGVKRWPSRKFKCLEKIIAYSEKQITNCDDSFKKESYEKDLVLYKKKLAQLYLFPNKPRREIVTKSMLQSMYKRSIRKSKVNISSSECCKIKTDNILETCKTEQSVSYIEEGSASYYFPLKKRILRYHNQEYKRKFEEVMSDKDSFPEKKYQKISD